MTETLVSIQLRNGAFYYTHTLTPNPNDNQHRSYMGNLYQIYYLISGSVVYQVENQSYQLRPGDLLIINNKEMHRPYFTSDESYERILIFFTPEFCSHYSSEAYPLLQYFERKKPGHFNRLSSDLAAKENLAQCFIDMEDSIRKNLPQSQVLVEITFIKLLVLINGIIASQNTSFDVDFDYNKKMEQIISFINNSLYRSIRLKEIEETFFINRFYFSHQFKKITGFSFKEYIINKRIARAAQLLKLAVSSSEAARMAGFEDYSNFYKAFKRIVGVSPSKYK